MLKNVVLNKTLTEYSKKYGKYKGKLLKYSKKEVLEYDAKHKVSNAYLLLKGRKWWLIDDTYYEVKKGPKIKILVGSSILAAGVAAGVVIAIMQFSKPSTPVEPTKYNVTYDAGEGLIDGESKKTVVQEETIQAGPNASRHNFLLDGWSLKPNSNDKVVFPYKITGDTTFYARWNDSTYYNTVTVYFDDGNDTSEVAPLYVKKGSCLKDYGTLSTPVKKDYKFIGWYYDKEYSQKVDLDKPVEDSIKLYAKYEKKAFTVIFNTEGSEPSGSREVSENSYAIDSIESLRFEPYTFKEGSGFLGWKDKDNNYIKYPFTPTEDNIVLTADFKAGIPTFNVSFQDNEGETISGATGVVQISTPPDAPTINGYKFVGWKDVDTGEMITFSESGGYQLKKNSTFKAQYEVCIFNVELYTQITTEGTPTIKETRTGCSKIENEPSIIVENCKLFKWYKEDRETEVSFPLEITEDTKLYGVYFQSSFSVEFYNVDVTSNETNFISKIANASKVEQSDLPKLTKKNHSLSWRLQDPNEGVVISEDILPIEISRYIKSGETLKVYSNWTKNKYDLTLEYPDDIHDKVVLSEQKKVDIESLKTYEYPKADKLCVGWSFDPPSKQDRKIITDTTIELTQDTTLYAVYEKRIFDVTVSYVNTNKEVLGSTSIKLEYGTHNVNELSYNEKIVKDSKTYKFACWSDDIAGTSPISEFNVASNRSVYAIYTQTHSISIKYIQNEVISTWQDTISDISSIKYNEAKDRVPAPPQGYIMTDKWYYKESGSETLHEIKDKVNPFLIDEDGLTIVFEFKLDSFTAIFYKEDGSEDTKITGLKNGQKIYKNQIPEPKASPGASHQVFNCWKLYDPSSGGETGDPIDFDDGFVVNTTSDFGFIPIYDRITKATYRISDEDYNAGNAYFVKDAIEEVHYQEIEVDDQYIIREKSYGPSKAADLRTPIGELECWILDDGTKATFPYSDSRDRTFTAVCAGCSKCTVCLDSGDGYFKSEGDKHKIITIDEGMTIGTLKQQETYVEPSYVDHTFVCWQIYDEAELRYVDIDDDYEITSNIYLHARFKETITDTKGTEAAFTTNDNWATIAYYANQGESVFLENYKFLNNDINNLIGKTRSLKLNVGTETPGSFSTIVCGVNHDDLSDSMIGESKGLITFSLLDTPYKNIYNPSMYTGKSNNWDCSEAKRKLNLGGSIYDTVDPIVIKYSKNVFKQTRKGQDDDVFFNDIVTSTDKLFLFSGTELGLTKDKTYNQQLDCDFEEGVVYKGFDTKKINLKRSINGTTSWWWIRSPYNHTYAEYWGSKERPDGVLGSGSNWITVNGTLNIEDKSTNGYNYFGDVDKGYIFGFVIGVQNV